MNEQLKEQWKVIPGTRSAFLISSFGRVFNVPKRKFIRPWLHKSRSGYYLRVNIGKRKHMLHILVAEAYVVNCDPARNTQVNHLDTNTLNCNATNLVWSTASENITHAHEHRWVRFMEQRYYGSKK